VVVAPSACSVVQLIITVAMVIPMSFWLALWRGQPLCSPPSREAGGKSAEPKAEPNATARVACQCLGLLAFDASSLPV
jgi:hypothetical protein